MYNKNKQTKFALCIKTSTNRICRMAQLLSGEKIVLSDGSKVPAEEYLKDKKFYEEVKKAGKNFEVVFVSRDRAADDLIEYFRDHHGPWAYLEFGNPKLQPLLEKFEVKTIPTCKVIKPDGTVVVNDARTEIQKTH
uniref:Thioredoxin-like_fold domain-containing protein n=1 Tax=Globodera pallida TaxID=36090 RepID=A0A183C912_GLOPA